ncbi:hypothetical protein SAMN05660443_1179 [Marinospirillum celere]|uniref:Uncharacterized protein n=1 Tax=Marinospirillum celere TaxID=1122252 RepID=A0A1I1FZ46_9GAMM|nr:DUF6164 family protein [Marinospirillum celere]SFC02210.1 hypothetical protein SAMN05660443_1179 [Marinospirillum celere]
MAVLLFKLNNVPDDEAQEVRALLDEKGFDYYETSAGRWRLGVNAIWIRSNQEAEAARKLLAEYQQERAQRARAEQAELEARGEAPRFVDRLATEPLKVLLSLAGVLAILLVGLIPIIWIVYS